MHMLMFLFLIAVDAWGGGYTEASQLFQCVDQLSSQGRPGIPVPTSPVLADVMGNATVRESITPFGRPAANGFLFESGPRAEGQHRQYLTLDKEMVRLCPVPAGHDTFLLSFNRDSERVRITHKLGLGPDDKDFIAIGSNETYNGLPVTRTMDGTYRGPTDRVYIKNVRTTCGLLQDTCYLDYQPRCETIPLVPALSHETLTPEARDRANKIRNQLEMVTLSLLGRLLEGLPAEKQREFTIQKDLKKCDMGFIQRYLTNYKNQRGYILLAPMAPNPEADPGDGEFIQ